MADVQPDQACIKGQKLPNNFLACMQHTLQLDAYTPGSQPLSDASRVSIAPNMLPSMLRRQPDRSREARLCPHSFCMHLLSRSMTSASSLQPDKQRPAIRDTSEHTNLTARLRQDASISAHSQYAKQASIQHHAELPRAYSAAAKMLSRTVQTVLELRGGWPPPAAKSRTRPKPNPGQKPRFFPARIAVVRLALESCLSE